MEPKEYHFTRQELYKLLDETIGLMLEYRDRYGQGENEAGASAIREALESLDLPQG